MPFTPSPYPADTTFTVGRRVKLQPRTTRIEVLSETLTTEALQQSGYTGPLSDVAVAPAGSCHVPGGTHGIVTHSVEGASRVLFIWRTDSRTICAALAAAMSPAKFVTQRGRPRFPGEPDLSSTSPAMPATSPAKPAAPATHSSTAPDVADALETLRQALQPKATVDEDAVRAIVEDAIEPLRQLLQSPAVAQSRARLAVAQASSTNPIMAALQRRYVVGQEAPANALLVAPPSLGKSFTIREFGKQYDLFLEHGCTDDLDEVATLLGGPVATGSGFEVVDGVLTQAVRAASQGQTVLLLLDEVLRMGDRPQESLLSFLTGVKTATGRVYRLRTRRFESGAFETIECPVANLHIVAAANLGARHPQEAFWSRWDVVRFGFDLATVEGVASTVAQSYGIADADMVGKRYAAAVSMSRALVASNAVRYPLDIRTLERACQLAGSDNGSEVLTYVASRVSDSCAHWSIDLGETDPSCDSAIDAIKTCLTSTN